MRILKRGLKKAAELVELGAEKSVFVVASQLRYWLREPDVSFQQIYSESRIFGGE